MRRSTAAAVGTLAGAALIMGVRLSVSPQPLAAQSGFDLPAGEPGQGAGAEPAPTSTAGGDRDAAGASANGLRSGRFIGKPVTTPYGVVQVAVTIADGKITAASVKAPSDGNSGVVNSNAVPQLKKQTLEAQSAEVDTVSGATYTSQSYAESLQAALDKARG